ncbi:MAG: hypothetical protein EOO50_05135 [Flavobacterium sp.]|uniref:hypothetical protein n=1 Tax=Flavobacterium sp. TaxID=239 RepID=UPI0012134122|nr:hypothetical protein [Flavobacterium sp.]RZJ67667.1 MAG: hypothetical protein EOO50_05135 [Flavobacterium sp.]
MRFLIPVLFCLLFSSCATILNKSHYDILFSSDKPNTSVTILDSTYLLPAKVNVKRQKKQIPFSIQVDSLSKNLTLYPFTDSKIAINASLGPYMPVGFTVDLLSRQRFSYGNFVNISTHGDSICVYGPNPRAFGQKPQKSTKQDWNSLYGIRKGEIYLTPGISPITAINISSRNNDVSGVSFLTARVNLDYAYADNRYFSVGTGFVAPLNNTIFTDPDYMSAIFLRLTDNYVWERFHFGYGAGFMSAHFKTYSYDFGIRDDVYVASFSNNSLTAHLDLGVRINRRFYFQVNYQPSIFRISPNPDFAYSHLLSFGFTHKLRLRKERP